MLNSHINTFNANKKSQGFTLIEVMLVIMLVGLMVSAVQFSFRDDQLAQQLETESKRFAGLFEIAAEYGMLNNVELGILIKKDSYEFLGYDGVKWSPLADSEQLSLVQLPENIEITLQLEDLPIEEPLLFDVNTFISEEDDFRGEEQKLAIPQIVILSGGDISPFSLSFASNDAFEPKPVSYKVSGLYYTPLTIEGPLADE